MAISIDSLASLQTYLLGVLDRADHHAGEVEGVTLALLGAVIWKSDLQIMVRDYNGSLANMVWFHVNNRKYVLSYNHSSEQIELKIRSQVGGVLHSFDNSSTYQEIIQVFNKL